VKAFTLLQPWATLIRLGEKRIETRRHRYPDAVGEWIAIHASSRLDKDQRATMDREPFRSVLEHYGISYMTATHADLPRRTIVAVAKCWAIEPTDGLTRSTLTPTEIAFGDYSPGRWAYFLDQVIPVCTFDNYLFATGKLGLWNLAPDEDRKLRKALQAFDIPDELHDDALLAEAIVDAERAEQLSQDVQKALDQLRGRRDTRTPIERMIDQAVRR
jgi:hypothetical protein